MSLPRWQLCTIAALCLTALVALALPATAEHDVCVEEACLETRDQEEGQGDCSSSPEAYQRTRGVYLTIEDGRATTQVFVEAFCYHNTGDHGTNDGRRLVVTAHRHEDGTQRAGASVLWGQANHQPPEGDPFDQCGTVVSVWLPGVPTPIVHAPCPAGLPPPQVFPAIP